MKRILALFLGFACLFVTSCASMIIPGDSYTKKSLHWGVVTYENAAVLAILKEPRSCEKVDLTDTKVIDVEEELVISGDDFEAGHWTEIWTFNKCGTEVKIRIVFRADGKGGLIADLTPL
jgi:hypothetical protein